MGETRVAEEYTDVLERIDKQYKGMSKNHKRIADYILENSEEAAFMTAAKLGEALEVSESTVVRFATGIGLSGFPEFHKQLGECLKTRLHSVDQVGRKYKNRSQSEIINSVLLSDIEKLEHTMEHLDVPSFDTAIQMILEAKTVYVCGLRSNEPLAAFLHFYLNMIRENVVLLNTTSVTETFEQMIHISDKDCFIGISFPRYSMRTLKAMEFAKDRSAKVIAITDTAHSPMNLYATCQLHARSDMVSIVDSLVAPLSMINALVVAICVKCPDMVSKNLKTLEETWNNYQVYLNDEINFIDDEPILNNPLWKNH